MGAFLSSLFLSAEDFVTKETITLWMYPRGSSPTSIQIKRNKIVKVLDFSTKWWHIEYKDKKGYASKYYFSRKNAEEFEQKLWFFGELPRNESHELLMNEVNSEGSFLVRYSPNLEKYVLCVNKHDKNKKIFKLKHFDIKEDSDSKFVSKGLLIFMN